MTPDRLEELIRTGDGAALAKEVASLTESERRALRPRVRALRPASAAWLESRDLPALALLACGTAKDAAAMWVRDDFAVHAARILSDRRPRWLPAWLEGKFYRDIVGLSWEVVDTLVREGACPRPRSEAFVHYFALIHGPGWRRKDTERRIQRRMWAYPEWIDEVWRFFEVDTQAFTHYGWVPALVDLAAEDRIDRQRLLDGCLRGLSSGFKVTTLSGYADLHEQLKPTPAEIDARHDVYLDLLAVRTPRVMAFAMREVRKLERTGRLDMQAFLRAAPRLFFQQTKGTCVAALSLLRRALKREPDLAAVARPALAAALKHEHRDVQGLAVTICRATSDLADTAWLEEHATDMPASLRVDPAPSAPESAAPDSAELATRALALAPRWREFAGVDASLRALAGGPFPPPLSFRTLEVPLLTGIAPVEPITTLDELIETTAQAVETVSNADEVERVLDGICRFCAARPADFETKTAPLRKRILTIKTSETGRGLLTTEGMSAIAAVLRAWLAPEIDFEADWGWAVPLLGERMGEMIGWVQRRQPRPLLAAPTHAGGWIDAAVLVERLRESDGDPESADFKQALLRLAPDGWTAARAVAAKLDGPGGEALREALAKDDTRGGSGTRAWHLKPGTSRFRDEIYRWVRMSIEKRRTLYPHMPWALGWIASAQPADLDDVLAHGAKNIAGRRNHTASSMEPTHACVDLIAPSDRDWGDLAWLVACLSLTGRDADAKGVAIDVFLDAVDDGRCHPEPFGRMLARLAPHGWLKPGRLAKALEEIAAASPLHELVVANTIEDSLANLDPGPGLPRGTLHVLGLLRELLIGLACPVGQSARGVLDAVRGSSKTASLSRALLDHDPAGPSARCQTALAQLALGRIERAGRWSLSDA